VQAALIAVGLGCYDEMLFRSRSSYRAEVVELADTPSKSPKYAFSASCGQSIN
jgi:hypothetical protein